MCALKRELCRVCEVRGRASLGSITAHSRLGTFISRLGTALTYLIQRVYNTPPAIGVTGLTLPHFVLIFPRSTSS